ncbi:AAA family ATPase [Candidatus Magnetobacterium casense]|uniref:AAA family ATPase n=1 Tax=Candidatus Magnetobacterium casense TaxID=1455061 RepID=UPI001C44722F|nr:AAA family ATPase [Candidatus Magnetobacterium casensis]
MIADQKKVEDELRIAGQSLDKLPREQWPCCVNEHATFMAPFALDFVRKHALATINPQVFGHLIETPQHCPAYSAGVVPYKWMMKDNYPNLEGLELDVGVSREPDMGYKSTWFNNPSNQKALLDGFAGHLRCEDSLCLFYAKHLPFVEGTGRILIGVGRIKKIDHLVEYQSNGNGMGSMVWERPIQHSIRPNGKDGFLMPYDQLLKQAKNDPSIDCENYAARAPSEHWDEFSYGSELVTHDGAIAALLSMDAVLSRMELDLGIPTADQRQWLHDELVRLWKVRGPSPGLGAVLRAFGLSRGVFVAHALQNRVGENADPWPEVDAAFRNPTNMLPKELSRDIKELAPTWIHLPDQRRQFLRLLSRFDLTVDQAKNLYEETSRCKRGWGGTDLELLKNPYCIYEFSRHDPEGIQLLTVDRGLFPDDAVRNLHPLDKPSRLDSAVDVRRVRAFTIATLEYASTVGHTLYFTGDLADAIRDHGVRPECPVTSDILSASQNEMAPEVLLLTMDGRSALQLSRYRKISELVEKHILGRVKAPRHIVSCDWAKLLLDIFSTASDQEEQRAQAEKAKALAELAESRFSALVGSAGTGKTSVLGILCAQTEIKQDGILLLAPTGKARVRMQQLAGEAGAHAKTIAQFLNAYSRYNVHSGRYHLSEHPKASGFGTVIVDESSMLTEDMLGALLDALQGVKRLILVGDPAQLPPIGAGRPFVDIVAALRPKEHESLFPRVTSGYAELTIERRQVGSDRPDLRLARWFSSTPPSAGDDDIFSIGDCEHPAIRFVEWRNSDDFQEKLLSVLVEELSLTDARDMRGFNCAMGATKSGAYDYFNVTRNGNSGAVQAVDAWQILSPIHGMPFGVSDINRQIHERFRADILELALKQRFRSIPKPLGTDRVLYGDKVINLGNHRRDGRKVYPQEGALGYLSNGEIGVVVGLWKTNSYPKILKVEFSSQVGYTYDFHDSEFGEERDSLLELAYALTVHKSQGSQFALVILVLPEGHPIISREMIYTALTRHQNRVVIMHQGPRSLLKEFATPHRSETARRRTNLLSPCKMLEFPQTKGSLFLQAGLIHRTSKGVAVRSKSELLIAEAFISADVSFEYEKPLTLGGITRYPDFTIENEITGRIVYWEHLGMLDRREYRESWEKKLAWYHANGIDLVGEGTKDSPVLVTTDESAEHGFDMEQVNQLIKEVCGG